MEEVKYIKLSIDMSIIEKECYENEKISNNQDLVDYIDNNLVRKGIYINCITIVKGF